MGLTCSFEEGLKLVDLRGKSMQQAADAKPSGMVSVIGLDADTVSQRHKLLLAYDSIHVIVQWFVDLLEYGRMQTGSNTAVLPQHACRCASACSICPDACADCLESFSNESFCLHGLQLRQQELAGRQGGVAPGSQPGNTNDFEALNGKQLRSLELWDVAAVLWLYDTTT